MRRYEITELVLTTVCLLASCHVEEAPESGSQEQKQEISITAGFESQFPEQSKTYISGSKIYWGDGDNAICVFDSKNGKNRFTSSESGESLTRTFTGSITSGSEVDYVLWTGKSSSETDDSSLARNSRGLSNQNVEAGNDGGVVDWDYTKGIPLTRDVFSGSSLAVLNPQTADQANSFSSKANIAIMKKGDTVFRNVFGYIRFTVPEGISSVAFKANENMAGNIQIDYTEKEPVVAIVSEGSNTLTVNVSEAGTFYAVIPPGTYTSLKIVITPTTGETFELSSVKPVVIRRGKYTECGTLPGTKPGVFVDGKAIVPCGYQGLLIER